MDKVPENYNKLQYPENHLIKSSTEEFTKLNTKCNDVDKRKTVSKAVIHVTVSMMKIKI